MTTLSKYNKIKTAYLSSLKTVTQSKATYDKYTLVLNDFGAFLEQHYPTAEQSDITPSMALQYKDEASKRGICRNTLRHYLIILRAFFKWCVQHKFYSEQPIFENDIPKKERVEYNLLTEQQIDEILNSDAPRFCKQPLRDKALIVFLMQTGLRVSELTALRMCDLDFESGVVRVVHGKGDKLRYTPFPERSRQLMRSYLIKRYSGIYEPTSDSLVFANDNGTAFTRQNITQIVRRYVKGLFGRNDIGAHDLRHAAASFYLTQGASLEKIQEILGHSNYATTVIYASHLRPQSIANDLNGLWRGGKCAENTYNP